MTVSTTAEYNDIKVKLLPFRLKVSRLDPKTHWIAIPKDLRDVLDQGFQKIRLEHLAEITGLPGSILSDWRSQRVTVEELKAKVLACRRKRTGYLLAGPEIKSFVCGLAKKTSIYLVSDVFEIPKSTVANWVAQKWDEISVEDLDALVLGKFDGEDDNAYELDACPETIALESCLKRHQGKVRRKYSTSEKKLIIKLVDQFGSKAVHERFRVSYDTIARLKRRQDYPLERRRTPIRYAPVIELMKKYPGMGPMQVRDYIHRHSGLSMGVNSIRKVMEQHGWVPPYTRSPRIKDELQLYEAVRKNYLWHSDFKHHYINKCKVFLLFIQDDHSRFIVGYTYADGEKIETVVNAFEEAIRVHGKPEMIMTDGGSAFYSWRGVSKFTRLLEDHGIDQYISKRPTVNGKLENLNQQVEKELLNTMSFASLKHFESEISRWIGFYNFQRPHQGLGKLQVPADRYFPGAKQWYGENSETVKQQSLIAETMATLLNQLKKSE